MDTGGTWRRGKRVAIVGAGPAGVSTAIGLHLQGFDVRLFERSIDPKALGGGVLLAVPVLAVLRSYGLDISRIGLPTRTEFLNNRGKRRVLMGVNPMVEQAMGLKGWHYGMLRSEVFHRMLERLQELDRTIVLGGHAFQRFAETADGVRVFFSSGEHVDCDVLIGADGIRSRVSEQLFGDPKIFFTGLRAWLAWCGEVPGVPNDLGRIHHSRTIQASYFPMLHQGKEGFEWWIVEPSVENAPVPSEPRAHLRARLSEFADPMPRFLEATDTDKNMFRWDIYNRVSLPSYTRGRIALVGDACHPVSPYAAYGMGMAVEDGYFLARALSGKNLADRSEVDAAFTRFDDERVKYCNKNVEFARSLGNKFHYGGPIASRIRDFVFDHTRFLEKTMNRDYMRESERMTLDLRELHVTTEPLTVGETRHSGGWTP